MTEAASTTTRTVPGRAARIAAIHMLADFLAEHPEVPMPDDVNVNHFQTAVDEPDESKRVNEVIAWGKANDARLFEGTGGVLAELTIASRSVHGVQITFVRHAAFDERPPLRYL